MFGRWRRKRDALRLLEEDLQQHIDEEVREHIDRGMSPEDAHRAARLRFGNVTLAREDTRAVWGIIWLEQFVQDLSYAIRTMLKKPAFLVVAVATIGLGIGANTTVFSVVYGVLFRPLPFPESDRLVRVQVSPSDGSEPTPITDSELLELRSRARSFSAMAGYRSTALELSHEGPPIPLRGALVSPAMFQLLGATALIGRVLGPEDEQLGSNDVVVLGYSAWQSYLEADADIIGRAVTLGSGQYTVAGVMPPEFGFPDRETQFWIPLVLRQFSVTVTERGFPFDGVRACRDDRPSG